MGVHSRPNGSTYFTNHPSLAPAVGAALDAELNALGSTVNSLDDANIDGTPVIQGSKVDLGAIGYLPLTGGTLSAVVAHAFEGVWQRMRAAGNGRIRYYNTDAGAIWGVCYNTEYDSGWNGRDVTDICWRLEMQSDGLHVYNAVSAASGVSPVWTEGFRTTWTGVPTAGIDDGAVTPAKTALFVAGAVLITAADTVRTHTTTTPTKKKEFTLRSSGSLRVKFDLSTDNAAILAYGQVYKNGVAVGTLQSTNSTSYVTFSEDIAGWVHGDLLQLYIYIGTNAFVASTQNFRASYDVITVTLD